MSQNKTINIQVRHRISQFNLDKLNELESHGVDKSSVINLALGLLFPRMEPIGTTDERIIETILTQNQHDF